MSNMAKLRHQLEVANALAKMHISFVVIPVIDEADEIKLAILAANRLEQLAKERTEQ